MPSEWIFEKVAGPFSFTEGPQWTGNNVLFTDLYNHRVLAYDPESTKVKLQFQGTNQGNGLLYSRAGELLCCEMIGRQVSKLNSDGTKEVIADRYQGKRLNSPNDIIEDSKGRIWFTDPRYGEIRDDMELNHESVYRVDPTSDNAQLERMTFDTTRPNGLLLSLDESTLYVAQSDYGEARNRELRAYPIMENRTLGPYRVVHNFHPARGIDGMTITGTGLILATSGWGRNGPGPMINVLHESGRVIEMHPVPTDMPTNICFGGTDLRDLYITVGTGELFRVRNSGYQGVRMTDS